MLRRYPKAKIKQERPARRPKNAGRCPKRKPIARLLARRASQFHPLARSLPRGDEPRRLLLRHVEGGIGHLERAEDVGTQLLGLCLFGYLASVCWAAVLETWVFVVAARIYGARQTHREYESLPGSLVKVSASDPRQTVSQGAG
jgi:hypothetical protein